MSAHRCSICGTDLTDINEPCPNCLPKMAWRPPTALGMQKPVRFRRPDATNNASYRLAMLSLQSERYQTDSEYRQAVDDVLGECWRKNDEL